MRDSSASFKHVPYAAYRMYQWIFAGRIKLATQPTDVNFDDVGARIEVITPHGFKNHGAREHSASVAHEKFEQFEFGGKQMELACPAPCGTRHQIEFQIADAQDHRTLGVPAQEHLDARRHF